MGRRDGERTALPDDRPRGVRTVTNHEPRHQHDRSTSADKNKKQKHKQTNKTNKCQS